MRDNAGDDDLAERFVRHADGLRHLHAGMARQGLIHLQWRDVRTAGADFALLTARDDHPGDRVHDLQHHARQRRSPALGVHFGRRVWLRNPL